MSGTVVEIGPGVEGFSAGDRVFAMADDTYAELCVVKAEVLAKIPEGLDPIQAAALPLATTTGNQLSSATGIKAGQTILVVGAIGSVGRSAVFTAKGRGATVIAGVLKRQLDQAKSIGADRVVATDDDDAITNLELLDADADPFGGRTAEKLIAKVSRRGVCYGSRRTAERREVPICKGGAGILEIRQENARVHGRSRARWEADNPD